MSLIVASAQPQGNPFVSTCKTAEFKGVNESHHIGKRLCNTALLSKCVLVLSTMYSHGLLTSACSCGQSACATPPYSSISGPSAMLLKDARHMQGLCCISVRLSAGYTHAEIQQETKEVVRPDLEPPEGLREVLAEAHSKRRHFLTKFLDYCLQCEDHILTLDLPLHRDLKAEAHVLQKGASKLPSCAKKSVTGLLLQCGR